MKTLTLFLLFTGIIPATANARSSPPRFRLDVEGGVLFQTLNEVQIPNREPASRIDLVEMIGKGPLPAGRLTFTWNIHDRHFASAVAAPLSVTRSKTIDSELIFDNVTFEAGRKTDFTYKFNSWRLNYHYRVYRNPTLSTFVGFTAKIRDAEVAVEQSDRKGSLTNLGFVPLLYLAADWKFAPAFFLQFDFNGLAGGPGRAFDISLRVARKLTDRWTVAMGYRTVEGGADVSSVYNFAWLHYGFLSVSASF